MTFAMLLKLDENLPEILVDDLAAMGHQTETCRQQGLAGMRDTMVAARASGERRILVTFDLDFADIRTFPPGTHPGIIVLRLQSQDIPNCRSALQRALSQVPERDFDGMLVVVEESRVRIRRPLAN